MNYHFKNNNIYCGGVLVADDMRDATKRLNELEDMLDTPNKSLDVTIDVVDEYIKFWSDDGVQEFYYDISPLEVLDELKTTLITGEYPTKMVEEMRVDLE